MSDYSWYKAMEPKIKYKNIEDLKKQIEKEEKRCKGRPCSVKLIRLEQQLNTILSCKKLDEFIDKKKRGEGE